MPPALPSEHIEPLETLPGSPPTREQLTEQFPDWCQKFVGAGREQIATLAIEALPFVGKFTIPEVGSETELSAICSLRHRGYDGREEYMPEKFLAWIEKSPLGDRIRTAMRQRLANGIRDPGPLAEFLCAHLDSWYSPSYNKHVARVVKKYEYPSRRRRATDENQIMYDAIAQGSDTDRHGINHAVWARRMAVLQVPEAQESLLNYIESFSENSTYRDRFPEIGEHVTSVQSAAPRRILDAGCSYGEITERLAKRFPVSRVTGYDLHTFPDRSRRSRARYVRGSILSPPFATGTFDVIILSRVLDHFTPDGIVEALAVTQKLVTEGGRALIGPFFQDPTMRWTNGVFLVCVNEAGRLTVKETFAVRETLGTF